jgi:hypothetical protein
MQKADPLTTYPIKLYSRKASDRTKIIFNYRLLHAQPTVECISGFSTSKWRNLNKSIETKGDTNVETVKFVALLHNMALWVFMNLTDWVKIMVLSLDNPEQIILFWFLPNK